MIIEMGDGEVIINRAKPVDEDAGTWIELFAVENSSSPGGVHYRFQYYDAEAGEAILRYDNAHDSEVGAHHRHFRGKREAVEYDGLAAHLRRFQREVTEINETR